MNFRDYPCMRREYKFILSLDPNYKGLPLHAQGILLITGWQMPVLGITPACAGNTTNQHAAKGYSRDYPCMRREYLIEPLGILIVPGLPLHAQGIHSITLLLCHSHGITPACAGNTKMICI